PPTNYVHLVGRGLVQNEAQVLDIITQIVNRGKRLDKPVVATGNVHYIENHDKLYRKILLASHKANPLNRQALPDTPYRTTNEMLKAVQFLGDDIATEIVVSNTQHINQSNDIVSPLKPKLYPPNIEGSD